MLFTKNALSHDKVKVNKYGRVFYLLALLTLIFLSVVAWPTLHASAATGTITIDINEGPVGTEVSVTGSGFTPSDNYTVKFATTVVSTGTIGTSGNFDDYFTVTMYPRGQYAITVTTTSATSNPETFTVTPEITLNSASGRSGSRITVSGTGFKASSSVTILFDSTSVGSAMTNASGAFSNVVVTIPSSSNGRYTITGRDVLGDSPGVNFNTLEPEISLSQASGHVGDQISVSGSGFQPSSSVTILFDNTSVGSAMTNASGTFSNALVIIPPSSKGKHTITSKDTLGTSPGVNFNTLEPEISLSQASGHVGDQISVSGFGFKGSSSVTILFDSASVGSAMTDADGTLSNATITIPPSSRGKHTITGKDTINASLGITFDTISSVAINPVFGAVGDQVTISGSGFAKSSTIVFDFDNAAVMTNAVSNASGSFTNTFTIPAATGGKHSIQVRDVSGNTETVTITVSQTLNISPRTGAPGTMVKTTGTGFGAKKPITIKYNGIQVATNPTIVNTDAKGSFNAVFEVPASLPGGYSVEASDASYSANTEFTSLLTATISQITSEAAPGHVGMQLTINGAGFKPNAKILVSRATTQEKFATTNTDPQGIFSVTFTVTPSPGGKHTIIVTDGVNSKEFDFFIERESPPSPLLLQPGPDKKAKRPVFFDWKDVSDISGVTHTLQISTNEQFTPVLLEEDNLTESEYTIPQDKELKSVTKENPYYWRVKAVDGAYNESEWSETRSFSVGFVLTLPNGEPDLTVPAWAIYAGLAAVILLAALSFWVGRKTFSL